MRRYRHGWGPGLIGLLGVCFLAMPLEAADFRFSTWGDPMAMVRQAETAVFHHQRTDELAFTDSGIDGIDGGIIYLFERGLLVQGVYVSRDEYRGGLGVMDDFRRMRKHFDETLGVEGEEEIRWVGAEPEPETEQALVDALVEGRVRVTNRWVLERTEAQLMITGKDGGVFLRAVFHPAG